MAMKLEGGERLVLKTLKDLQGDTNGYVDDARLAAATKMYVQDVRDWLETLEGKGFVERARGTEGFSAYVTAKGKQALRLTEPIPSQSSGSVGAGTGAPVVATPAASAPPATVSQAATAPRPKPPVEVFFSYSHKDKEFRDELEEHLSLLKRQKVISGWHDRQILPGGDWAAKIDEHLV